MHNSVIAEKLRSSVLPASNYIWYKMYESSGTTISDSAGNGPAITLSGTLTNAWDNPGYVTLNNTDQYAEAGTNTYIDQLMNLSTLSEGERLIVTFDYAYDGVIASSVVFFSWGLNGTGGGWFIQKKTAEQIALAVRGQDAPSASYATFSGYTVPGSQRNTITIEIIKNAGDSIDANLYANGGGTAVSSVTDLDLTGSGGTIPSSDSAGVGFTLFARRAGALSRDQYLEGQMGNMLIVRHAAGDANLAISINAEMHTAQGDLPWALDGK